MARSISQIYDALIDEKEGMASLTALQPDPDDSQTLLSDLTTTSKVAIWRLMFFVVAVGIWAHEVILDQHKADVEALSDVLITATPTWLQDQALKFQLGDTLVLINDIFQYSTIDATKQIVKRAAIVEAGGLVLVKVAKLDGSGNPEKLSASERGAFTAYINKLASAGTNISVISRDADLLKVSFDVHYDPLVLGSSGELLSDPAVFPVEDAIKGYIQNLPFNGVMVVNELIDAVQAAQGVDDPVLTNIEARFGSLPYAAVVKEYVADAGHMKIDPLFPLTGSITYIAA